MNIAEVTLFHRKKSGLSRNDLAKMAGVGKTVIYDIEHGKKTVRLESLMKVFKVLNISVELKSPLMKEFKG